jgi:hypothetical protein
MKKNTPCFQEVLGVINKLSAEFYDKSGLFPLLCPKDGLFIAEHYPTPGTLTFPMRNAPKGFAKSCPNV